MGLSDASSGQASPQPAAGAQPLDRELRGAVPDRHLLPHRGDPAQLARDISTLDAGSDADDVLRAAD